MICNSAEAVVTPSVAVAVTTLSPLGRAIVSLNCPSVSVAVIEVEVRAEGSDKLSAHAVRNYALPREGNEGRTD